jgi:hypothetical protein
VSGLAYRQAGISPPYGRRNDILFYSIYRYMKNIKRFGLLVLSLLALGTTFAAAPSFDNNFAKYLTDATPDAYGRVETVFTICVDRNLTLMENIKNLFYPGTIANPNSPCAYQVSG